MYHEATQPDVFEKPKLSIDPSFNMSGRSLNQYSPHVIRPTTKMVKPLLFSTAAYGAAIAQIAKSKNNTNGSVDGQGSIGSLLNHPMTTTFNENGDGPGAFMYDIPDWLCSVVCSGSDVDEILDMKLGDGYDPIEKPPAAGGEENETSGETVEEIIPKADNNSVFKTVRGSYPCDGMMPFWEHCLD